MSWKAYLGIFLLLQACAGASEPEPTREERGALVGVDLEDFESAFADAACLCQARLLSGPADPGTSTLHGDERLGRWSDRVESGEIACHDRLRRPITRLSMPSRNGCQASSGAGLFSFATGTGTTFPDGFCRADFNHCLASELETRSESLGSAPRSRAVRDALRREARERFQAASVEMAASLGRLADVCQMSPRSASTVASRLYDNECRRLQDTDYADHATSVIADGITHAADLLEREAESAMAASDGLSPVLARTPRAYVDALWGPESPRFEAAERVMGDAETVAFRRAGIPGTDTLGLDAAYADRYERDERIAVALDLLMRHEVPVGVRIQADGSVRVVEPQLRFGGDPAPDLGAATYHLLDHQIAAEGYHGPYALAAVPDEQVMEGGPPLAIPGQALRRHEVLEWDDFLAYEARPLEPTVSPLRSYYGLEEEHVRAALEQLRNILTTLEVDYRVKPRVHLGDGTHRASIRLLAVRQRPIQRFAGALLDLGRSDESVLADPLMTSAPLDASGRSTEGEANFYSFDFDRMRRLGAQGALQQLRVHLRRLQSSWAFDPASSDRVGEPQALEEAVQLVDAYAGDVWFEYSRWEDRRCECLVEDPTAPVPEACRDLERASGYLACSELGGELVARRLEGRGHFDVYFPEGHDELAPPTATAVLVDSRDEAFCLRYGHRPDGSDEGCQQAPGALPSFRVLDEIPVETYTHRPEADELLRVAHRRFVVPDPEGYARASSYGSADATAYVLWRTGEPGSWEYALLDVIQPRRDGSVHLFGGRFGELFADLVAKDPSNPGRPLLSSIGLPYDLVPPLENELIADGDAYEDSYQVYLSNAASAATSASAQLRQAREFELEAMRNDRADVALLAEASLAEEQTITEACGEPGGCDLERVPEVRLGELYVEGQPLVAPATMDEIPFVDLERSMVEGEPYVRIRGVPLAMSCGELLGNFTSGFSYEDVGNKRDWPEYTEQYLSAGLGCARYVLLHGAAAAVIRDVPWVVRDELARGGDGQFAPLRGEVRQPLIQLFQDLLAMRNALRSFESGYQSSLAEIQVGAARLDDEIPSRRKEKLCKFGKAMAVIGTIASAVVSCVVTFGAGAVAVIAAVVAAAAAGGSAIAGAFKNQCGVNGERAGAIAEQTFSGAIVALENLQVITDETRRLAGRVALGDEHLDRLQRRAEVASRRRAINERVIATNALSDMPEWRALQNFRVRRARRAMERAQQYAFVARRAVEVRLGVDLSLMSSPELFTEAPGIWSNDLFTVDSASSAEGAGPDSGVDHVNTSGEALEDYVEQLQDFVRGYPFTRRFRDATDVQVLRLDHLIREPEGEEDRALATRLLYKCVEAEASVVFSGIGEPCEELGGVEYAELPFAIPAEWDGYLEDRLAAGNFNYRHRSLAVNLVGSALVDCRRSSRPRECYTDGNIQYSLRQEGSVLLESFERELMLVSMEPGVIEGGRALAVERVLTNPISSVDRGLIAPFERAELWGRPLRGAYRLRIHGRPEIDWRRLEGIQLLLEYGYWTRQE